jgi:hypothetical protein
MDGWIEGSWLVLLRVAEDSRKDTGRAAAKSAGQIGENHVD